MHTTEAVTEEFLRTFAERWDAAWNAHDTEAVLTLVHPEIEWEDTVFWPEVIHGVDGLREYTEAIWRAMPDVHFEGVQLFVAPDDGRGLWLFRQSGHAPAQLQTDKTFSTYGCDIWLAFDGGLLRRYLAQYEITEMMRQYGALPPRGRLKGGAYLLHLATRGA